MGVVSLVRVSQVLDQSVKEGFRIRYEGVLGVINHDGGVIFEAEILLNLLNDDVESIIIYVVGSLLPSTNRGVEYQTDISSQGCSILFLKWRKIAALKHFQFLWVAKYIVANGLPGLELKMTHFYLRKRFEQYYLWFVEVWKDFESGLILWGWGMHEEEKQNNRCTA